MNASKWKFARLALFLVFIAAARSGFAQAAAAPEMERRIAALVRQYDESQQTKNVGGALQLVHPQFSEPLGAPIGTDQMKKEIEQDFAGKERIQQQSTIESITPLNGKFLVRLNQNVTTTAGGKTEEREQEVLLVLQEEERQLLILKYAAAAPAKEFDAAAGVYHSAKGRYTLTVPAGWVPVNSMRFLRGMTANSMALLTPDLESGVMIGVVQLPIRLDAKEGAKQALHADEAAAKRMIGHNLIQSEGPLEVNGINGYQAVVALQTEAGGVTLARKRIRAYFLDGPLLYFFICDAIPPQRFDALRGDFERVIHSLRVTPTAEGATPVEALAAEHGTGGITGRTYTSEKFNCFIAAPEGWQIRTSSNPNHLCEMQFQNGKSIARLIAADGIGKSTLNELYSQRVNAVRSIAQNFQQTSRRETTIQDVPAIVSTKSYALENLGEFQEKEAVLIKDQTYYMILCQCISPDNYEQLEKDFDQIIRSFGFIQ